MDFPVAEQIFVCGLGGLFCDNYIVGGGTLVGSGDARRTKHYLDCYADLGARQAAM